MVKELILSATFLAAVDGDTIRARFPAWSSTPFEEMDVRIAGIDTPESHFPLAKCEKERRAGVAAKAFAKTLAAPGDHLTVHYVGKDKYFRIDGNVALPDGRDWGGIMLQKGMARPYTGGKKSDWCK